MDWADLLDHLRHHVLDFHAGGVQPNRVRRRYQWRDFPILILKISLLQLLQYFFKFNLIGLINIAVVMSIDNTNNIIYMLILIGTTVKQIINIINEKTPKYILFESKPISS